MRLTRRWLNHEFTIPTHMGTSDSYAIRGNHLVSWNSRLGYFSVAEFHVEQWRDTWKRIREDSLSRAYEKSDTRAQQRLLAVRYAEDALHELKSSPDLDDIWTAHFVQDGSEVFPEFLERIPERLQRYYSNTDMASICHDYPHKVIEHFSDYL